MTFGKAQKETDTDRQKESVKAAGREREGNRKKDNQGKKEMADGKLQIETVREKAR